MTASERAGKRAASQAGRWMGSILPAATSELAACL